VYKKYKSEILQIMDAYLKGTNFGIGMRENGLISGGESTIPLTWMDAMVNGHPVTIRNGFAVEVNALWYNAIVQVLEWSGKSSKFGKEWKHLPDKIREAFIHTFWIPEKLYLADHVNGQFKDSSVRPNQLIAASMEFSPLTKEMKKTVLDVVQSELLTSKGIRTLSPKNNAYKSIYLGDQEMRESAAHQGTVYPWLLEHFAKAYLAVHNRTGLKLVKQIYSGFEEDLTYHGIGTISELYDGNPPHDPKGAISFAASVASILRLGEMIDNFE
jgi:predicted glycogen debranching enzyme